jgi:glutamate-1-semialdehyde 2,1-aminomutase
LPTNQQNNKRSVEIFEQANKFIPGGVNSPVRAFAGVGCPPIVAFSAKGEKITDADGNEFTDFMSSWGPMILGHAHPNVVDAVTSASANGFSFGLATEKEAELAELIVKSVPSVEKIRLVNSGTEATMSAIRLARGFTGRDLVVKFEGCYHGHADFLLVKAGSGLATHHHDGDTAPSSGGVPQELIKSTINLKYNDLQSFEKLMQESGDKVAAVILEPVAANMGVVPPSTEFLKGLRSLTENHGAILIFDEVMTGFRLAKDGAQGYFGIEADLTTYGKIIGGGLPVGAYGGRQDIMNKVSPLGDVYQAGTLSGNPLTVAAGLATLETLFSWRQVDSGLNAYEYLEKLGSQLEKKLAPTLEKHANHLCLQRVGSMFTLFFQPGPLTSWHEVSKLDGSPSGPFARFFTALLQQGVLFPPSAFEAAFLSLAHSESSLKESTAAIIQAITASLS